MGDAKQPTGTVTFLFTDIEGSTALWEQAPLEMEAALERHDAILRSVINRHRGHVFSTAGDAFAVAFDRPVEAIAASREMQDELASERWGTPAPIFADLHDAEDEAAAQTREEAGRLREELGLT